MKYIRQSNLSLTFASFLFGTFLCLCSQLTLADEVDDFINNIYVATYDCPDDKFMPRVENYLADDEPSPEQLIGLRVYKAHWLICVGKNDQAQNILETLLLNPMLDESSLSYASIHYQLGFIFDVQEKPKRCEYYRQSEQLSKEKFNDVYLSSQLGLITVCDQDKQDIGVKLGRLFNLVETYSKAKDQKALAHIHNNIGLLYSSIGQMALAAEQYKKTYELGLDIYEEKNQIAPLISVITAYSGSGDYDNSKLMIEELRKRNLKVNTPLTNSWYHFAQSRQAYRTEDYESLRQSLRSLDVFLKQISNRTMQKLYELYKAALCLHDGDKVCVEHFLENHKNSVMPVRLSKYRYYIGFLVKAYLFVGDVEAAQLSFDRYTALTFEKINGQQTSARVLGVAKLHNEIIGLETSLAKAQENRFRIISVILVSLLFMAIFGYLTLGRRYLLKLETDQLTGLANEHAVLTQIKKVKAPLENKVNALALFDVNNLNKVNAEFGYKVGESVIGHVAGRLKQVTREKDIVGRIGTEQFIVCLKNIDEAIASDLLVRMQKMLTDVKFKTNDGALVDIFSSMHVYSSTSSLLDVDDVLSEIRNALRMKTNAS